MPDTHKSWGHLVRPLSVSQLRSELYPGYLLQLLDLSAEVAVLNCQFGVLVDDFAQLVFQIATVFGLRLETFSHDFTVLQEEQPGPYRRSIQSIHPTKSIKTVQDLRLR